jgi:uncharacterized membrane protein
MVNNMIIRKNEWFKRDRKAIFGYDISWQGYVYIAVIGFFPLILVSIFPKNPVIYVIYGTLLIIFVIDMIDIFLSRDERERMHEAIAWRNASFSMIITLFIIMIIQSFYNFTSETFYLLLTAVIVVGCAIMVITKHKLEKEN